MEKKRERRIRDYQRMKARAKRKWLDWGMPEMAERAGHWADNMKRCSCWMCAVNRRLDGPSIQERKNDGDSTEEEYS